MEWDKPDSQAAIDDQAEHSAFMQRCATDLAMCQAPAPPRAPAPRSKFVTDKSLGRTLEGIGRLVRKAIREATEPLQKKIAELEQKQLTLGGVWKAGERYKENTLVSFQGGLWISRADTTARPGSGSPSWRLCVKKGDGDPK